MAELRSFSLLASVSARDPISPSLMTSTLLDESSSAHSNQPQSDGSYAAGSIWNSLRSGCAIRVQIADSMNLMPHATNDVSSTVHVSADMIKQASRALLWDRIMIMETYRLITPHRSFSHLYDTQFIRSCFTLRNMLLERRSCYLTLDLSMQIEGAVILSLMMVL